MFNTLRGKKNLHKTVNDWWCHLSNADKVCWW